MSTCSAHHTLRGAPLPGCGGGLVVSSGAVRQAHEVWEGAPEAGPCPGMVAGTGGVGLRLALRGQSGGRGGRGGEGGGQEWAAGCGRYREELEGWC